MGHYGKEIETGRLKAEICLYSESSVVVCWTSDLCLFKTDVRLYCLFVYVFFKKKNVLMLFKL